jgi:hypothetical protein
MILDMIQGCRYLRRSTDRWLLSKNSTTRLEGLETWHGAGLLWNCSIPITNTKGSYLYPWSNTTPSRPRLQHLLPKFNSMVPMSVSHSSSIRLLLYIQSTSSRVPECFSLSTVEQLSYRMMTYSRPQTPSPNALRKTSCRMVLFVPNSAHRSVSSLYQFLVLTKTLVGHWRGGGTRPTLKV